MHAITYKIANNGFIIGGLVTLYMHTHAILQKILIF